MRKRFAVMAALLAMAALTGCSGGSSSSAPATTAAGTEAAGTEAAGTETADAETTGEEASEDSPKPTGGTLFVDDTGEKPVIGYPAKISSASVIRHVSPSIETLFRNDDTGTPQPYLLDGYDLDMDAMTLTLHVKEGIRFHDGTDFNAAAVQWNFEEQTANGNSYFNCVDSYETPDDYTLVMHLNSYENTLLSSLCSYAGMMVSPTAVQENGADWAVNNPVGTGPFKFVSWEHDVEIVYEKNEDYWQPGKPYVDEIVLSFTADDTSRELSLRNGDIDVMIQGNTSNLKSLEDDGYTVLSIPAGTFGYTLYPSSANPDSPFADVRVRQAVSHAIDREKLVTAILNGYGEVTNQLAHERLWSYNKDVVGYDYDVDKAKELMAEAGYADGFTTTYTYNASSDNADLIATAVQEMLGAIGITANLEPAESSLFDEYDKNAREWDGLMQSGSSAQPDTADQLKTVYLTTSSRWVSMKRPDGLDDMIMDACTAKTMEEKAAKVQEIQKVVIDEDCTVIPMFMSYDMTVTADYVHDSYFSSGMPATVWHPENVYLEK